MKHWRRLWLGVLIAGLALIASLGLPGPISANLQADTGESSALTLDTAGLSLEELGDGVYGLIASTDFPPANPATDAICNGGIVIGADGVLVVDPFQNEALGDLLFQTVATLTDQPVRYVVNTHYHFDHTGGNPAAASRDLPILGRGPIREFMIDRNAEMDPQLTPPAVIVNGDGELWLGDRQVKIHEYDGHTGGTDLTVYIPDSDVLMTGDLLFNQRIPYIADGSIRVWQQTLQQLQDNYSTAVVMPGHGPITDSESFLAQTDYLDDLVALALDWQASDVAQDDAIATPLPQKYSRYLFQGLFPSNLETAYQQITLGQDDAAAIEDYFQAQAAELQAL